jgi:hypothetical protein
VASNILVVGRILVDASGIVASGISLDASGNVGKGTPGTIVAVKTLLEGTLTVEVEEEMKRDALGICKTCVSVLCSVVKVGVPEKVFVLDHVEVSGKLRLLLNPLLSPNIELKVITGDEVNLLVSLFGTFEREKPLDNVKVSVP